MQKSESLNLRVDEGTKNYLMQLAEKNNTSMSKVVQKMISDAIARGEEGLVHELLYINGNPRLRGWLEWYASNEQFFEAAASRIELPGAFKESYGAFMTDLGGFLAGLATAAKTTERNAKSN